MHAITCIVTLVALLAITPSSAYNVCAQDLGISLHAQQPVAVDVREFEDGRGQPTADTKSGAQSEQAKTEPAAKQASMPKVEPIWYQDPNNLTAIASVGALIISIIAWFTSHRSSREQAMRQRREELRGLIEKLVDYRSDFNNKFSTLPSEQEKLHYGKLFNTKRSVCLDSAEVLSQQLERDVSFAEFAVLAQENYYESDYSQARKFYLKAVKASERSSSLINQVFVYRMLAANYFIQDPFRDLDQGRKHFEKSLDIIRTQVDVQRDPYSIYTHTATYREWAHSEMFAQQLEQAKILLGGAVKYAHAIPDWYNGKYTEIRQNASMYCAL